MANRARTLGCGAGPKLPPREGGERRDKGQEWGTSRVTLMLACLLEATWRAARAHVDYFGNATMITRWVLLVYGQQVTSVNRTSLLFAIQRAFSSRFSRGSPFSLTIIVRRTT